ncbi:MAG: VOC family protein [Leptospirales bacterium]|jgi:predicted enzyme related to lactoylglutathione lyase
MRINVTSLFVKDQYAALRFYTEVLGFVKKTEVPMGEHAWLTVVSGEERDGVELLLEPMEFPPAGVYQKALFEAGIPAAMFNVDDVETEHTRLINAGVEFSVPPTLMGPATIAVFDDTCGNNIQIVQV